LVEVELRTKARAKRLIHWQFLKFEIKKISAVLDENLLSRYYRNIVRVFNAVLLDLFGTKLFNNFCRYCTIAITVLSSHIFLLV